MPVSATMRDQHGRTWQGAVVNVSEGGIAIYMMDMPPLSQEIELQFPNSSTWTKLKVENCRPVQASRFLVGCSFPVPPTPDFLKAISAS
jgi:hypothetical protein